MWTDVDRFARPKLGDHLHGRALEVHRRAVQLCVPGRGNRPPAALVEALVAGDACWRLFRQQLGRQRWRRVKAGLARQRRLMAADQPPLQEIRELLAEQGRMLSKLSGVPDEARLMAALTKLYRKARRAVCDDPTSAAARRHLRRLVAAEELMLAGAGPMGSELRRQRGARRMLLAGMEAHHRLRAGRGSGADKRRRRLGRGVGKLARVGFRPSPAGYRAALPWPVFLALAPAPQPWRVG